MILEEGGEVKCVLELKFSEDANAPLYSLAWRDCRSTVETGM
jgi:hypothetical protein